MPFPACAARPPCHPGRGEGPGGAEGAITRTDRNTASDVTAQTGAGNLLGNLLCAVTNLLNGVGSLIDIANLLNQILQILIGLLP